MLKTELEGNGAPSPLEALTVVGHLGWDVIETPESASPHVGGSMFHFLNGIAFACLPCVAVAWTTPEVATQVETALPPWISLRNLAVERPPRFDIAYRNETLTRFDISGIQMPAAIPGSLRNVDDMHFCAMPPADIVAILAEVQPTRWSVQFHSMVLTHASELERLRVPPEYAFCTSSEFRKLSRVTSAFPASTWIVTDRDRVTALRDGTIIAVFDFPPFESPVDTTGAGDLLAGSIIGSLRRGVSLPLALRFATGVVAASLGDYSSDAFGAWWRAASHLPPPAHF